MFFFLAAQAEQAGQAQQADPANIAVFFHWHRGRGAGGSGITGCRVLLRMQRQRASNGQREGKNSAASNDINFFIFRSWIINNGFN